MYCVYLDESGYTFDWQAGMATQPFYVLSAVAIPAANLSTAYDGLRNDIAAINLPTAPAPLGKGHEIKAGDIASGAGWWSSHNTERNAVRDTFLQFPQKYGGTAFCVVIDKAAHFNKYYSPENPYLLALRFILERLEHFLKAVPDSGICIYDHNKRLEADLLTETFELLKSGSGISFYNSYWDSTFSFTLNLDHILELSFGNSKGSIGLQVADFYATMAYQYFKGGKPTPCGWWNTLEQNLHRLNGVLQGVGLKVFP